MEGLNIQSPAKTECVCANGCVRLEAALRRKITVWHQSTGRAIREQTDPMHSNHSRGTLMSYGDHSAQRCFKLNVPILIVLLIWGSCELVMSADESGQRIMGNGVLSEWQGTEWSAFWRSSWALQLEIVTHASIPKPNPDPNPNHIVSTCI